MSKTKFVCPECESDSVEEVIFSSTIPYGDSEIDVPNRKMSVCGSCGCEFVNPEQNRYNDRVVNDARRNQDGLLVSAEIQAIREQLGINQDQASRMFGGGRNAFSKYENGVVNQSLSMDRLLRVASKYTYVATELARISDVKIARKAEVVQLFRSAAVVTGEYKTIPAANMSSISSSKQSEPHNDLWRNQA